MARLRRDRDDCDTRPKRFRKTHRPSRRHRRLADPRSVKVGTARGYSFEGQTSRRVSDEDFDRFDYILAMDSYNLSHLRRIKPADARTPPRLFLEFAEGVLDRNVPDPYYGGAKGFDKVLDLIELASEAPGCVGIAFWIVEDLLTMEEQLIA